MIYSMTIYKSRDQCLSNQEEAILVRVSSEQIDPILPDRSKVRQGWDVSIVVPSLCIVPETRHAHIEITKSGKPKVEPF